MSNLKEHNLALFLTEKHSLQMWEQAGIISREIAPYNILANYFKKIYIFSYGNETDLRYKDILAPNIEVVPKSKKFKNSGYVWLLPFIHRQILKKCRFLKTNQFKSRAALIAKLLNPKSKLILRTGYMPSLFLKQSGKRVGLKLRLWEWLAYKICDAALVTSKNDKDYLIASYNLAQNKIKIIPNFIDTDLFKPLNQLKYSNKILYIGRISPEKNLKNLVIALGNTDIRLDVIGSENQQKSLRLKEEIFKLAKELGVNVNFLGVMPNDKLPNVINQYKLLVLPSLHEGMPKSLLEAMSCGLACLATDVSGSREIIENNRTGILVNTDSESLRAGILKLASNQVLQKELGENAREFIVNNFSLSSQIKNEVDVYENLI